HTKKKQPNPYFGSLVARLKAHGVEADGEHGYLSILGSFRGDVYDIVHVHFVADSPLDFLDEFTRLAWHRLLGSRIVKTCHNIRPHAARHPRLAFWFERLVNGVADHVIFFTDEQRKDFCAHYRF